MSVERIYIRSKGKQIPINSIDICCCVANGNKTIFHFHDKEPLEWGKTLKYVESILDNKIFVRIHDKYLVNSHFIKEILDYKQPVVILKNGKEITVSYRNKTEFNKFINQAEKELGRSSKQNYNPEF